MIDIPKSPNLKIIASQGKITNNPLSKHWFFSCFLIKHFLGLNFLIEYQCWNMIKIKLKSNGSTEKQFLDKLPFSRMEPTCNPLISTTSAEQTVWKLQTLKLADFKPLYLFVSFLKELCETEILSSRVEGKETCSFLEVLNECKSKWEVPSNAKGKPWKQGNVLLRLAISLLAGQPRTNSSISILCHILFIQE